MTDNRRSVERNKPLINLQGKCVLHAGSDTFWVYLVRDVSPFGMGIKISEKLEKNTRVRLSYSDHGVTYEVRGNVVWSAEEGTSEDGKKLYATGVLFTPMDTSINIEFYNILMGHKPD